ncbi:MAG: UDP-glucosyltransferase [bacterium]|nr:UDP-glucosyltransferase [bacterium]
MRILFYAVNGLGLGHVTRLLAIAREIKKLRADAEILFITSSEADSVIFSEGFPAVKVPSKNIARESGLRARIHARILQQTAWSVFSAFNPHITVVDTFPLGFTYELDPVLLWKSSKFVFVYRQRKQEKTLNKRFQTALNKYDLVIVPHEKDAYGVELDEEINALYAGRIIIRGKRDLLPVQRVVDEFDLPPGKKYALITLGGGGQEGLEELIRQILGIFKEYPGIHPVVAHGNLMRKLNTGSDCTVIKQHYPICELYNAFDYVIAGCGYNTVNELLYFNKPALYLPFERQVDDQYKRARDVQDAGLGLMANPWDITDIKESFNKLVDEDRYNQIKMALKKTRARNNARKAARAIVKLTKRRG